MMKHILAILFVAILLFGCTQPGGGTQAGGAAAGGAGSTGGTGAGGTGTGGTGGSVGGTGATGGTEGAGTGGTGGTGGATEGTGLGGSDGGSEGDGSGSSGDGSINLGEWSMDALIAMGVPIHCTVTYGGDVPGTFDMYVMGDSLMVTGQTQIDTSTQDFTEVMKTVDGKKMVYVQFSGPNGGMEGCDWISFELTEEETTPTTETTSLDVEQTPVSYECFPGTFGQEKFATAGSVCDYSNLLNNPSSICDQYTGDVRDQCLAAMG